jgi:hypothetical protein
MREFESCMSKLNVSFSWEHHIEEVERLAGVICSQALLHLPS